MSFVNLPSQQISRCNARDRDACERLYSRNTTRDRGRESIISLVSCSCLHYTENAGRPITRPISWFIVLHFSFILILHTIRIRGL